MMLRKLLTISYVVSVLTYLSVRNPYFKTIRINSIRALHASKIALTREAGTNDKLSQLLAGLDCYEIPCIQFFDGDDLFRFPDEITKHDVVVITSPQGANVFLNAWKLAGKPKVNIAVVGKGTAKPLQDEGVQPFFQPSDFTGESLAMELPVNHGTKVLYPTSAIAENTVESGLIARGFQVTRLNTYTTGPATWSEADLSLAKSIDVVTFASPSAVRTWADRVGTQAVAVTIGPTSQKVATSLGFSRVYCPEEGSKGLEPWATLIRKVVSECSVNST